MIRLTAEQYEEFQNVLEWETASPLPDGRLLGNAEKRGCLIPASDVRVETISKQYGQLDSILEFGPCEGYFTVQLAKICNRLTSLELRPKNIVATLTRLFLHEINNVDLQLFDVRNLDANFGHFDLLFHCGVLYHLSNPVEHLYQIAPLADRLYLETHYLTNDDQRYERADITYQGQTYPALKWSENDLSDVWAGAQRTSQFLYGDSLLQLLQDIGYSSLKVAFHANFDFAPRVGIFAERKDGINLQQEQDEAQRQLNEFQQRDGVNFRQPQRSLIRRVLGKARRVFSFSR